MHNKVLYAYSYPPSSLSLSPVVWTESCDDRLLSPLSSTLA